LVFALAATLAGCGGDDKDRGPRADGSAAPVPLETELVLLALPGYAGTSTKGGGNADPRRDWVGGFERDTGCRVRVTEARNPGDLFAKLATPGFDVAVVPGEQVLTLVASGDIQPIDTGRVRNLAPVDPRLADGEWARVDGERYAIPFVWRPQGLVYRTDVFEQPPREALLFTPQALPDGAPNAGRMQVADSPMAIADAALYLAQTQPALGIEDPHALDARQYAAALALARTQATLLHRYWSDPAEQREELEQGAAVLATGWPLPLSMPAGAKLAWAAPEGPVPVAVDATVLATGATHPQCAYAWLAWSLDAKAQEAAAASLSAVPVNLQACAGPLLGAEACARLGAPLLPRAHVRRPARADCGKRTCIPYSRWAEDFMVLRGD
jgi:putative spermidine/putrescine transport system substrate-binding protein